MKAFVDPHTRAAYRMHPPEYLDHLMLARWLVEYEPLAKRWVVTLPPAQHSRERRRYLCGTYLDSITGAYLLGTAARSDSPVEPRALRQMTSRMGFLRRDSVLVYHELGVPSADAAAMLDSLDALVTVLGLGPRPATYILLFVDLASLRSRYPHRYPDGQPGAISHLAGHFVSVAFIPRGSRGFAAHELVHNLMAPVKDLAAQRGRAFPTFANEALARALGGDTHRAFHAIAGESDAERAATRIRASLDSGLTPHVVPGQQPSNIVNVLSSLYSVAARRCRSFPMELLLQPTASVPARVAEDLARRLAIPRDSVIRLAAGEMVNDTSVIVRAMANPASRAICSPRRAPSPR